MNRPNELIKELKEFNETMYGYGLSRSECKGLTDNKGTNRNSICPKNRDCLYIERDCNKCWKEYLLGGEK